MPSLAGSRRATDPSPDQPPQPLALTEPQMCALLAASYPLPPAARGVSRLLHLGLTRWRQSYRQARFRPSPSPSSPRACLWPLPGRDVARLVSSGEVVAGPSHRLQRPRPHARIQTRLFISSARALCETIARVRSQTCPKLATAPCIV
jgi:hypothetical protein